MAGLYLYLEKGYTGKEVQNAHIQMAKKKKNWPMFELPEKRGDITVSDVLNSSEGNERKHMIQKWCESVWKSYADSHEKVKNLMNSLYLNEQF